MPPRRSKAKPAPLQYDQRWNESAWRSRLRRRLLDWFADNARTMPWRSDPQSYYVWVSEIMLQQTQVATVLPYFERFITSFPDVRSLADADEADLMRHWEGLGYYRRARSLHAAAKQIVDEHDGVFPTTYEEVLALPGVGRYTAGAILSISQNQKLPILEGNTLRVFSRWISLRQPPADKAANDLLWEFAEKMLPKTDPGIFNQAAMELGALVCTPRQPACDQCPVQSMCSAYRDELQTIIPGKITKTKYEDRTEFALVISKPSTNAKSTASNSIVEPLFLMRPLPDGARWAGLWDFPRPTEQVFDSADGVGDWLSNELGLTIKSGLKLKTIRHAVTKYRISLHVHAATIGRSRKELPAPWQFVPLSELDELPMSVTGRQVCDFLKSDKQERLDF